MLNFLQYFLSEAKKPSEAKTAEVASDDKGKLHELLLSKHLHPKNKLPSHRRSKSEDYGGTPEQVHNKLKAKLNKAAYNEINTHAKQTAGSIISHLGEHGHIGGETGHEIHDVHWTSNRDAEHNPGDHEKTTGIKDRNSNADLIITTKHNKTGEKKFIGISAKYGSLAKPNYKNSGLQSLEKETGHPKGTYTEILHQHTRNSEKIGYSGSNKERHAQYKLDKAEKENSPTSAGAKRAAAAEQSSLQARTKIAGLHRSALSRMSDSKLRNIIRSTVSPKTVFPHIVAHSLVQSDGSAVSLVHPAHTIADEHLANFSDLHMGKEEKGTKVTIKGTVKSGKNTGKIMNVASHVIKGGSGPHKGFVGVFTLR